MSEPTQTEQLQDAADFVRKVMEEADCGDVADYDSTSPSVQSMRERMAWIGGEYTRLTANLEDLSGEADKHRDKTYKIEVKITEEKSGDVVLDVDQPNIAPRGMGDAMQRIGTALTRQGPVMQIIDQARTIDQSRDMQLAVQRKLSHLFKEGVDLMSQDRQRYTREVEAGLAQSAIKGNQMSPEDGWTDQFRPGRM